MCFCHDFVVCADSRVNPRPCQLEPLEILDSVLDNKCIRDPNHQIVIENGTVAFSILVCPLGFLMSSGIRLIGKYHAFFCIASTAVAWV